MPVERSLTRLRLRAPDEALARRARFLIEDALRTASLPGEGAEVVLVRRIALPAMRAGSSRQAVAAALEATCRRLAPLRVDGGVAEAALEAAAAVRFDDPLHACRELAGRLLRGERPRAWCWALAVKGYRPGMGAGEALRTILMTLAGRDEAPAAVPPWCDTVVAGGGAPGLLAALTAEDAAILLRALPARATLEAGLPRAAPPRGAADPARSTARAWREAMAWAAAAFSAQDDRLRWFAALAGARAGAQPGPVSARRARAEARARMGLANRRATLSLAGGREEGAEARTAQAGGQAPSRRPRTSAPGAEPGAGTAGRRLRGKAAKEPIDARRATVREAAGRGRGGGEAAAGGSAPGGSVPGSAAAGSSAEPRASPAAPRQRARRRPVAGVAGVAGRVRARGQAQGLGQARALEQARVIGEAAGVAPPTPASGARSRASAARAGAAGPAAEVVSGAARQATAAGGLLFLLPLLEALGFPAWLASQPEGERERLAARLLGAVLDRLRLPADDPMRWLTAAAIEGGERSLAVARLRAARRARSPAAGDDAAVDAELAAWLMRCRRWLRGVAGIGLASLVLRRAMVAVTPTHVDVWLALEAADIRVRRAGLDVDPGWVPWLGRVVCFHYARERG